MLNRMMAAAGLLALAACGSGDGPGNGSAAAGGGTAAAGGAGGGGVQLQPGEWETTTEMVKVEGMPKELAGMMAKPRTAKNCITAEQVQKANTGLFGGEEQKNCKHEGFAFKDGRVSGKLSCTGEGGEGGTSTMEMDGRYTATSYDVTSKISTDVQGMKMNMESRTRARRLGDCPAGGQAQGG